MSKKETVTCRVCEFNRPDGHVVFSSDAMKKAVANMNRRLKKQDVYGEFGRSDVSNGISTNLSKVSHQIRHLSMKNGGVYADVDILPTPNGEILKKVIDQSELAIRGMAFINNDGSIRSLNIVSLDFVKKPDAVVEADCTEDEFWRIVDTLDWRHLSATKYRAYEGINDELKKKYPTTLDKYHDIAINLSRALRVHIDRYAKTKFKSWDDFCQSCGFVRGLSDDSQWYLCTFIVGCGKDKYDRVMVDPSRISEFLDYKEGFTYCFSD